jgi:hypothetical protein
VLTPEFGFWSPDPITGPPPVPSTLQAMQQSVEDGLLSHRVQWYRWEDSADRLSQTGMTTGDFGFQQDTEIYYWYSEGAWIAMGVWYDLTLLNSWTRFNTSNAPAQYMVQNNVLYLRGLIRPGTWTTGTVLFKLPIGFRPNQWERRIPASISANGSVPLKVLTNGDVALEGTLGASPVWLDLSNLCIPLS